MNFSDIALPVLGFGLLFNSAYHSLKNGITWKLGIEMTIGLFIMGLSIWVTNRNSDQQDKDSATIDSLNARSSVLSEQIFYLRNESKASQKEYTDSIISYHNYTTELLAQYGLKVDRLGNTVRKIDTSGKREGTILIQPGEYLLRCDTLPNRMNIKLAVCNFGDAVAKNVQLELIAVHKLNKFDKIKIGTWIINFSAKPDCNEIYVPDNISKIIYDTRQYLFIYNITYTDSRGKKENYTSGIFYKYDLAKWTNLNTNYSEFFKK